MAADVSSACRASTRAISSQRSADLSVDHAEVVQNYRSGREIAQRHKSGQAGTEDLRQAMIHFRELFSELVGGGGDAAPAAR